ncbi:GNAT family N-acetyltransferase [Aurantimonas sp. VKM B-3413]|uniref:GNAT family N-acetyltransferase n=1 Tax=Aurantimonas sp. VKM B-3413 TaxID=2779401 RepID=UPI001E604414|nr:GNAT family N-acetyltransferase [Aurantimonas sp. VKM B-3413]MCB8839284.1 GNAT family N-acetyltransferase [Aurantimonas sp. VKM B-3413]
MQLGRRIDDLHDLANGAGPAAGPRTGAPDKPQAPFRGPVCRRLSIYAPADAFALVDELKHLSRRAIEPNVFFDPTFLVPAMPRLDERQVRLMVMRDEGASRSRLRLLMPYTLERTARIGGIDTIRAWSHPFGRLGVPPLDGDDPHGTLASFLAFLAEPERGMPDILVLPDIRSDGAFAAILAAVAAERGLPIAHANKADRAAIDKSEGKHVAFLQPSSGRRRREMQRQWRLLEASGPVSFQVVREADAVRLAFEDFLALEASGWKGRQRSALVIDRFRAAFAREAVNGLAQEGRVRIFALSVGARTVASLVVLLDGGDAFAWKMAYDEAFAKASPGQQVVAEAARALIADPAVKRADSCAMPDHFAMNRFWPNRTTLATVVVGLRPGTERKVAQAAKSLDARHRSRNLARLARQRVRGLLSRG